LELNNLGGVFLVLIVGSIFGLFVAALEMILGVKERCDENQVFSEVELYFQYALEMHQEASFYRHQVYI